LTQRTKRMSGLLLTLKRSKKAIKAVKDGRDSLLTSEVSESQSPIIFRPEQKEAIEKTEKYFKKGNEMLWFAKMRLVRRFLPYK